MAYREFEDPTGRHWRAWDVHPSHAEQRTGGERRQADSEVRSERRQEEEPRALMPPELMGGWLCFETDGERRRLVPIPAGWSAAPVEHLHEWLHEATPSPLRSRKG